MNKANFLYKKKVIVENRDPAFPGSFQSSDLLLLDKRLRMNVQCPTSIYLLLAQALLGRRLTAGVANGDWNFLLRLRPLLVPAYRPQLNPLFVCRRIVVVVVMLLLAPADVEEDSGGED